MRPEAKLRAVIEITRSLAGTVDLQAIVPLILDTLFSIFPQADRGCILLKDAETARWCRWPRNIAAPTPTKR